MYAYVWYTSYASRFKHISTLQGLHPGLYECHSDRGADRLCRPAWRSKWLDTDLADGSRLAATKTVSGTEAPCHGAVLSTTRFVACMKSRHFLSEFQVLVTSWNFLKKRQTRPADSCGISRASHWCPLRLRYRFHHRSLLQTLCVWLPLASTSCPTVELGEQFLRRVGFALITQFYRESSKKDQTTEFRTKWDRKRHFHAVETEPKRSTLLLAGQRLAPWLLHCCHLSTMPNIGFIGISRLWLCLMQHLVEFGFRKWNCFDTLVVLLQWADYAAEMMPGKLVQSGNLGILSLHSHFLLVPFCWSIKLFIVCYRFNLLVALYVCTYERCTYTRKYFTCATEQISKECVCACFVWRVSCAWLALFTWWWSCAPW